MDSVFRYSGERLKKSLHRDADMGMAEWMENNIYFSSEEQSPITGSFDMRYSPHLTQLCEYVDDPTVTELWCKWASQSAKSLFGIAACAKKLDTEPAVVIYSQPNKDDIPKLLDVKIDPVLRSMKKVWGKFREYKDVEKIRTKGAIKKVAGGALVIAGSSVKERKTMTSPFIVADEIGEFEKGAILELRERSKSFSNFFPFFLGISTIVHPNDEICTGYDSAITKISYDMYCRSCKTHFIPSFKTVKYLTKKEYAEKNNIEESKIDIGKYKNAVYGTEHIECPSCLNKIFEDERKDIILNKECEWVLHEGEPKGKSVGSVMNSACSFFSPLEVLVENIINAGDNPILLNNVKRGWFSEFHEDEDETYTEASELQKIISEYEECIIPDDTVAVYMGVDTQKDHFWAVIVAYRINKNPSIVFFDRLETFKDVYTLFKKDIYYRNGDTYTGGIMRMAIDMQGYVETEMQFNESSGKDEKVILTNRPQEVLEFVYEFGAIEGQLYDRERIYATRGHEKLHNDMPIQLIDTKVEIGNRREKRRIKMMKMNSISLKLTIMSYINRAIMIANGDSEIPNPEKNVISISKTYAKTYGGELDKTHLFEQLTSEEYGYVEGKKFKTFTRIKKENHALDCVYSCEALAQMDRVEAIDELPARGEDVVDIKTMFV